LGAKIPAVELRTPPVKWITPSDALNVDKLQQTLIFPRLSGGGRHRQKIHGIHFFMLLHIQVAVLTKMCRRQTQNKNDKTKNDKLHAILCSFGVDDKAQDEELTFHQQRTPSRSTRMQFPGQNRSNPRATGV
jgi:hypothetical protein